MDRAPRRLVFPRLINSTIADACPPPNGRVFISADDTEVISSILANDTGSSLRGRSERQNSAQHGRIAAFATMARASQPIFAPRTATIVFCQSTFRSATTTTTESATSAPILNHRQAFG